MKSVPYSFLAFLVVAGLLVGCGGPEPGKGAFRPVPTSTMATGAAHERQIIQEPAVAIVPAARAKIGKTERHDPAYVGLAYPGGDVLRGDSPQPAAVATTSRDYRTVRVYVALADNKTQGIVPVPAILGNGDDPGNNLYWGALYGVKAFLKRSSDWQLTRTVKQPADGIMERCVLRHKTSGTVLTADAYRGAKIKQAVTDFLRAASGSGGADLVVYVGHNGLMDFSIAPAAIPRRGKGAEVIILACRSKPYFMPWLERLGASPVLLTTGLMAPEAYTLEAALEGWIKREAPGAIRERAAAAYHKYQKCGMTGARRLFYSQ